MPSTYRVKLKSETFQMVSSQAFFKSFNLLSVQGNAKSLLFSPKLFLTLESLTRAIKMKTWPVNKISKVIMSSSPHTLCESFWNVVRLNRVNLFWHFGTTFWFVRLEMWCDLEIFPSVTQIKKGGGVHTCSLYASYSKRKKYNQRNNGLLSRLLI